MVCEEEPFKKLVNQGKIQGRSSFVYRVEGTKQFVSKGLKKDYRTQKLHVDIEFVNNDILDTEAFKNWREEYKDAEFILEDGKYICGWEIEKMSKSKYNVQNPDDLVEKYGADTFRLYEMFLGPIESHKPWDTKGIEGVFRFMRKLWKLYHNNYDSNFAVSDEKATDKELKVLHATIKKVQEDIERLSFNTVVSTMMIAVNELTDLKCNKREVLEPLAILLASYAPHAAEELWSLLGHEESITKSAFPAWDEKYLKEDSFEYPVSFNGKMRFKMSFSMDAKVPEIQKAVLENEAAQKYIEGKDVKKVIVVPKKIINIVVK
jgi:leucyl-tRNA synthetase